MEKAPTKETKGQSPFKDPKAAEPEHLARWTKKLSKTEQKKFEESLSPKPQSNDCQELASLYSLTQQQFLTDLKLNLTDHYQKYESRWDDWFLLRFCRARKWNMVEVMKMLIEYYDTISEHGIYTILTRMEKYKADYVFKEANSESPHFSIDRTGRPVKIDRWGAFNGPEIIKMNQRNKLDMLSYEEEGLIHAIYPICSNLAGRRIDNDLWIHDFTGFPMKI
jgi:hypothetical protein